ncbi:MAG: TolC family protein, partial [Mariniphaga sp.]
MKKIDVCFTGILLMLAAVITQAQEAWSFQECLDYAMENNIRIKQQQLSTQYSENLLSQAKHERLPNLNGSLSNNLNFGRSLTYDNTYQNVNSSQVNGYLSTDITLWNGSILSNTIRQREFDLHAAMQDLQKTRDDIALNIAASYLEILFAEELTWIAESQIEVTSQQIERTVKLVDAGSLA